MNKRFQLVLLTMLVISASFSQTPSPGTERKGEVRGEGDMAEAIIAREEGFWDAWKNHRADFFKQNFNRGECRRGRHWTERKIAGSRGDLEGGLPCTRLFVGGFQGYLVGQECLPPHVPSPAASDLWRQGVARNRLCKLDLRDATGSVSTDVPSADSVCDVKIENRDHLTYFDGELDFGNRCSNRVIPYFSAKEPQHSFSSPYAPSDILR
jgi:hypothetical protein